MNRHRIVWLHPRHNTLNRYADRTLGADRMHRLSVHLIGCTSCREELERIKRLRDMVRAERAPAASSAMFEQVLARRQSGDRVILPFPAASTPPRRSILPWQAIAAAVAVIVVSATALLRSREATAASEDGELRLTPAHPQAGAFIDATYHLSVRFANDTVLMLRGRFVAAPRDVPPGFEKVRPIIERVAMRRDADGDFHARLVLPANAVYSAFAVEDESAQRLDINRGALWEVLAHGADARPSFNALLAATAERMGWDARHDAARELVAMYPDSLSAWRTLAFTAGVVHGESDSSLILNSQAALERFDTAARRHGSVTPDVASDLFYLARALRDSARADYWKRRVLREAPLSRLSAQQRGVNAIERFRPDSNALAHALPDLDRIWSDVGAIDPSFTTFGLQSAIAAANPAAIVRWGQRYRETTHEAPGSVLWVGTELVKYSETRPQGLAMLRALLAPSDLVSDQRRRLRQTVRDRQREVDELRAETLQRIGEALLADGHHAAALDSLRMATRVGWNLTRFRDIAAAALRSGDTTDATQMLAYVSVDPSTPTAFVDSARATLGASVSDSTWRASVTRSTPIMRERVLATAIRIPLRGERVRLSSMAGDERTFADLAGSHITVVAFGADLRGRGSPVDLRAMERLSSDIAVHDARVVVIALHRRTADAQEMLRRRGHSIDVFFDPYHEADRAFSAYGFPLYFVVDASGAIRFSYSDVEQLRAQVSVLALEKQIAQRHK